MQIGEVGNQTTNLISGRATAAPGIPFVFKVLSYNGK